MVDHTENVVAGAEPGVPKIPLSASADVAAASISELLGFEPKYGFSLSTCITNGLALLDVFL